MTESNFRRALLQDFRSQGIAACAIEDKLATGVPDVFWRRGALELKTVARWPVRGGVVRLRHELTRDQWLWGWDWVQGGGRWEMAVRVDGREGGIFVFDVSSARYAGRGRWNREQWESGARWYGAGIGQLVDYLIEG
jgi:hypothetical protein